MQEDLEKAKVHLCKRVVILANLAYQKYVVLVFGIESVVMKL
jgi:hypothetical protein